MEYIALSAPFIRPRTMLQVHVGAMDQAHNIAMHLHTHAHTHKPIHTCTHTSDYTMVDFVKPNLLGTLREFTNRFANPIKNGQCRDSTPYDVRKMKHMAHVLHSLLAATVQVCTGYYSSILFPTLNELWNISYLTVSILYVYVTSRPVQ